MAEAQRDGTGGERALTAPRTGLESAIVGIWRDVLSRDDIGVDGDFFELGGDSLKAVTMLAAVDEVLLAAVSFPDFLDAPTIGGLAAAVTGARERPARDGPRPTEPLESGEVPCTFAQERLWFVDQLAGSTAAYNEAIGARVRGALDADILTRSLSAVIRRHAALRTSFAARDGVPVQIVHDEVELTLELIDLRGAAAPEVELDALTSERASRAFDLETAPLLRACLITVGDDDHVFQLVLHHNVCDGASHVILLRELAALYDAGGDESAAALARPPLQYSDFARWQRDTMDRDVLETALAPWRERLAGAPEGVALPFDRPRPATERHHGAARRGLIDAPTSAAVRALGRTEGATPFAILMAVFDVLLHRYSGQTDIVIGTAAAGRDRPELADVLGFFVNTIVLRIDLSGDPPLRELLGRARRVVFDAVAHQDAPFERLVAELQRAPDLSRHPIFQIFLSLRPHATLDLPGAEPFHTSQTTSRTDLTLWIEESPHGFELIWEYSTDLFDDETIERLERHFLALLVSALRTPEAPISTLAMIDETERGALIAAAGEPPASYPVTCMHELFERHAELRPDATAVSFEGTDMSYGDLNAAANRLAHDLRQLGIGRESLVALYLERSPEMVVAILAVLKAGGAYVPLDPGHPAARSAFVLTDTRAHVLVTQEGLVDRLPPHDAAVVIIDLGGDGDPVNLTPVATPDDLAYVIYTSGSTGQPKGVQVEHRHIARLFTATEHWYGFGDRDVWMLAHSYAFDVSVWELWGALAHGGRIAVCPFWVTRSPDAFAALVADQDVTVLCATPSLFTSVQDELLARGDELALRFVVFAGEALQPASLQPWFERFADGVGPDLVNMYGITETTVHSSYRVMRAADCERDTSPIGVPIPDLTLHVLDTVGEPVPIGVAGELYVGGAGVTRGYLNRDELTRARFIANPFGGGRLYRSGDVARRLPGGELEFHGRMDDQVKIRGFRIELGEVQATLRAHAAVADCAVLAVTTQAGDVRLAAYVVPDPETAAPVRAQLRLLREGQRSPDEISELRDPSAIAHRSDGQMRVNLRTHLEQNLPDYMVPASIVLVESLPLTTNGKLDRRALPAPEWESSREAEFVSPQTPTESAIAEVWSDVLSVERVGRDDSFFRLGGHSLLAARVVARIRERHAIALAVRTLFEQPTLSGFAAAVDAALVGNGATVGSRTQARPEPSGGYPLAFPQQQLLFFDELAPGSATYNAALATRVIGPLDDGLLLEALSALYERHEALRSAVVWGEDSSPMQVVQTRWTAELPLVDLSGVHEADRAARLEQLLRENSLRPFDLATDLMLRATLFRLGSDEHVLLFVAHHVAFDAWSVELLYRDLGELYAALRAARPPRLPRLARRYGDFARDQRERFAKATLDDELAFWRSHLGGAPTTLRLPLDRGRLDTQSFDGASHFFELDAALAAAVRAVGLEFGATPYMVLLASFATLLYRVGGQDDILLGGPMANRETGGFDDVIGFFANTVVVRARLTGNPTFAELLERVRESVLRSYEHQDVPFELVVNALRPARDPGINPVVQVNFRARVGEPAKLELAGTRTTPVPVDLGFARFDLALELHLLDDRIAGELTYNTTLFDESTAIHLAQELEALLRRAVAEPATRLLSFPVSARATRTAAPGIRGFRRSGT